VLKLSDFLKKIVVSLMLLAQFSCMQGEIDPFDRITGMTRSEINDTMIKSRKEEAKAKKDESSKSEAPIPDIAKLIITPPPPAIGGDKTISFSVTEQVPLKDVLIEMGRMAKIDIDLDPTISGGIIINARNRPLKEVIDRIATLGNLRYSYKNNVLYFERDSPYTKNYFVDYLIDGMLWNEVETNINAIFSNFAGSSVAATAYKSSFSANKSAGIISVFATEKEHKIVANYLADVKKNASAQVLIEAKIVEVALNDAYQTGIDWSSVNGDISASNGFSDQSSLGGGISLIISGVFTDINSSVSALETFGVTKTLSSPRIHAVNNQKASLNFADKQIYFKVDATQSTSGSSTSSTTPVILSTYTSTMQQVDVGIQLDITPSINLETNEITMNIKPQLSDSSETVTDPASPRDNSGNVITALLNKVPVVQTRTITTMAKIKSGNVLVIGGLMKENTSNTDSGIPLLSRIPVLGWFFKSVSKDSTVTETVIFIKATIVHSSSVSNKFDRQFQQRFDPDKKSYFGN
jgi:general secretion pathway protein D